MNMYIFVRASLFCLVLFIWSALIAQNSKENFLIWGLRGSNAKYGACKNRCRPPGSEPLPEGIVASTSNLEKRPLWGSPKNTNTSKSLFAVAVGIKQKKTVNEMVQRFLASDFVVMLFHYDGIVDEWQDFEWSNSVIHISTGNQTKWWFAKRFLHPDIVAEYDYIFLWDEDLGVENFNPDRYLSIVKDEGLQISQPALDISKSEVHHLITARGRRKNVHRRTYKLGTTGIHCDENSSAPPCTGWIEVMAPVFSKAAWRCVWYMIQNDLIHAWGLDMQLGYCAQGDRTKNVGVVDAEYIVHLGVPTLGESDNKSKAVSSGDTSRAESKETSHSQAIDKRIEVRRQSYYEYMIFKSRWKKAAEEDKCWVDPYSETKQGKQTTR
ncbi:uncharacterized protein LOC111402120 isoform X1 [Olea europaea subsp. europaea]|uniref:Uncharacterized protein LOC111402120 isoform X1 n=1 Tax=Olea europaea subsp. europaea TaxID=158383 RepID=A0A8S0UP01_OLEEU|nr:uncharacterized protein LOC111402120 isoform X1 [Olea europaea subsp. europaea]